MIKYKKYYYYYYLQYINDNIKDLSIRDINTIATFLLTNITKYKQSFILLLKTKNVSYLLLPDLFRVLFENKMNELILMTLENIRDLNGIIYIYI